MACDSPLSIKYNPPIPSSSGGLIYYFPADCGKCLPCLIKRKAQWSYRMVEEMRISSSAYFVTLTYEEKNVPWAEEGYTVNKNDHFAFIKELKRLEKPKQLKQRNYISEHELYKFRTGQSSGQKLKYYGISEYGDRLGRPHWHYILFNVRDIDNIRSAWALGRVQVDDCNINTIDYVLKYMVKDHSGNTHIERERELSFMSKGLGLNIADQQFQQHIKQEHANQVLNQRGSKVALPRYYRKKFLTEAERLKKGTYIAKQMADNKERRESDQQQLGLNPDLEAKLLKDHRNQLLKSRQKRNNQ